MMIDGWPVKVILKGDSTAAGALLPYAGNVAKQMNACRVRNKTVKVKDATIQVRIDPPAKLFTISIEASPGIKFVSGLVDIMDPFFPVFYDEGKTKGERFGVRRFFPRTIEKPVTTEAKSIFGPDWIDEPLLVRTYGYSQKDMLENRLDLDPLGLAYELDTVQKINSGCYTGLMRKHVQVMQGLGLKVPLKYHFHISHGIYLQRTDTKTIPWLIEISAANGVIAGKYPTGDFKPRERDAKPEKDPQTELFRQAVDELGYCPANSSNLQPKDVRVLLTQTEVGALLEGMEGYAINEGWAFNYSGTEAQLVCWKWVSYNSRKGYRFKVSISAGEDGPVSATIEQVEEGYLWGDRVTHFKYYDEAQGGIISFDLRTSGIEPPEATDLTWRVFYDKDDNEVLCKYKRPQLSESIIEFNKEGSEYADPGVTQGYTSGSTRIIPQRMVYVDGQTPDTRISRSFTGVTIDRDVGDAEGGPLMFFAGTWWILCESSASWIVTRNSWTDDSKGTSRSSGIAPFGNREGVYIYNRDYRFFGNKSSYQKVSYHAVGNSAKAVTMYDEEGKDLKKVKVISDPGQYINFGGSNRLYHAGGFSTAADEEITRGAEFQFNPKNNGHVWETGSTTVGQESESTESLWYISGAEKHELFVRDPIVNVGDTAYVAFLDKPGYQTITAAVDGFGEVELCSPEVNEPLKLIAVKSSSYPTEMTTNGAHFVGMPVKPESP